MSAKLVLRFVPVVALTVWPVLGWRHHSPDAVNSFIDLGEGRSLEDAYNHTQNWVSPSREMWQSRPSDIAGFPRIWKDKLTIEATAGAGSFGTVWIASMDDDPQKTKVAIKYAITDQEMTGYIAQNDAAFFRLLSGQPHFLGLIDVVDNTGLSQSEFTVGDSIRFWSSTRKKWFGGRVNDVNAENGKVVGYSIQESDRAGDLAIKPYLVRPASNGRIGVGSRCNFWDAGQRRWREVIVESKKALDVTRRSKQWLFTVATEKGHGDVEDFLQRLPWFTAHDVQADSLDCREVSNQTMPPHMFILMEAATGLSDFNDLEKAMKHPDVVKDARGKRNLLLLAKDAVDGVKYMHSKGWLHRDIKPANILMDGSMHGKVGDLGLACDLNGRVGVLQCEGQAGTPAYMAPEILKSEGAKPSKATDVWSFGILLYKIVFLHSPQCSNNPAKSLNDDSCWLSTHFKDRPLMEKLFRGALAPDPESRYTMSELKRILNKVISAEYGGDSAEKGQDSRVDVRGTLDFGYRLPEAAKALQNP